MTTPGIGGLDKTIRVTVSICPVCYKQIPAAIHEQKGAAYMWKLCSEHGEFQAMVETDEQFYRLLLSIPSPPVYHHQVVDVTHRCNVACPNCYYPVTKAKDRSIASVIQEIEVTSLQAVLSGGEPTLRNDLPELVQRIKAMNRPVSILTNGIRLANEKFLDELCEAGLLENGELHASISLHTPGYIGEKRYDTKMKALDLIAARGAKVAELMFTVQSLEEVPSVIEAMRTLKERTRFFRLRSPFMAWAEQRSPVKFFVSELLKEIRKLGPIKILEDFDNNVYHVTVKFEEMTVRVICCPDKSNIDIGAMYGKGPFHRANNGELTNLLHSFMINEGMAAGWLNGRKIAPVK